jgi:tetratricopeptide (TPR) repeat protein
MTDGTTSDAAQAKTALSSAEAQLFRETFRLHESGHYADAERNYEALLAAHPDNFDLLQLLGALKHSTGKIDDAVALMERALSINPDDPDVLNNLGNAFYARKEYARARSCYERAIEMKPGFVQAQYNCANALLELNSYSEAIEKYESAIRLQPNHAEALFGLARAQRKSGDAGRAIKSYERAITAKPDYSEAYNNLGVLLGEAERYEEALETFNRAVALRPNYTEAYCNRAGTLGNLGRMNEALSDCDCAIALQPTLAEAHYNKGMILSELRRFDEAIANYEEALHLKPDYPEVYLNRGLTLRTLRRYGEAIESYNKAIALRPHFADAFNNRAIIHKVLGDYDAAFKDYDRAIAIQPDFPEAHWNKSQLFLLLGDYPRGWELYEWRWKKKKNASRVRNFPEPVWLGESDLSGKTLLVHGEQGLGDSIQMLRYVSLLSARGAKVLLEVPRPLAAIAASIPGVAAVLQKGDVLPRFDMQCPLMSLPLAFHTTVETIPSNVPYLYTPPVKRETWARRLGAKLKPRVGLVWSGNPEHTNDYNRSIPLERFMPLLEFEAEFHSLQKEYRDHDAPVLHANPRIKDWSASLDDFSDTAGLIEALDLVIAVDTSAAHLAGALGKEVWILLLHAPDFRWLLNREDSPWYSGAKLFRQSSPIEEWPQVIARVKEALSREMRRLRSQAPCTR